MVSSSRRRSRKQFNPRALLAIFSWFEILCSACFGKMVHFKKLQNSESRAGKMGKSERFAKLDLSMGNLSLQPAVKDAEALPCELLHRGEESEMFEGRFYAGSKVLTEVEMRSPVEECNAAAAMVKASRSSVLPAPASNSPLPTEAGEARTPQSPPCTVGSGFHDTTDLGSTPAKLESGSKPVDMGSAPSKFQSGSKPIDMGSAPGKLQSRSKPIDMGSAPGKLQSRSKPIDIASPAASSKGGKTPRKTLKPMQSVRESLLAEAWARKRDHILQDEPSSTREKTKPEAVGRSVSECGKTRKSQRQGSKARRRTRSLTDDDFDELRGCIDLGFVFSHDDIPDLCETLPALEVCYAITQKLYDPQGSLSPESTIHRAGSPSPGCPSVSPISSWKIASPGDQPQQVKARLRHWAQAVACTVRQCC